jgi:hypothetical protein
MSRIPITVRCKSCATSYSPDLKTNRSWACPQCRCANPNLRRHYRSVADLCILGLIATGLHIAIQVRQAGFDRHAAVNTAQAAFLLVTILAVYLSPAPWNSTVARSLIWLVFSLALFGNIGVPLLRGTGINIPIVVIEGVVFAYLFWLEIQTRQCRTQGDSSDEAVFLDE